MRPAQDIVNKRRYDSNASWEKILLVNKKEKIREKERIGEKRKRERRKKRPFG